MNLEVLDAYATMALKLNKAEREILDLKDKLRVLETTSIPKSEIIEIFESYSVNSVYIKEKYKSNLVAWIKGEGFWPTYDTSDTDNEPFN